MIARPTQFGFTLSAVLLAFWIASPVYAQCGTQSTPPVYGPAPQSHREIDGVVYYFDQRGRPLYKDDYAHYNYPRRLYYRNGGWVLVSRSRGYYGHYAGGPSGVHHRSYSGYHAGSYSRGHGGYLGGHGGAHFGGHRGGHAGGHGHH